MLYDYMIGKFPKTNEGDVDELSKMVAKLLYFKIDKANIEPWKDYYYPDEANLAGAKFYMNCGIPQGLPQSYFFGNLCMIEVKRLLMTDEFFKGDAYFYVDDSVIYIPTKLGEDEFKKKIGSLNKRLQKWCEEAESRESSVANYIGTDSLDLFVYNLDEVDDHVSLKKLQALDAVISREIKELTSKKSGAADKITNDDSLASRLKMLRRFKKNLPL